MTAVFSEIGRRAEGTDGPFYFYSKKILEDTAQRLRSALSKDILIYYSLKANPHPEIIKSLKSQGYLADVSSMGELKLAQEAGFTSEQIEFTGPGKTKQEIETAVKQGVAKFVVESMEELEKVELLGAAEKRKIPVVVRISPSRKINSSGREVSGLSTQFGISESEFSIFSTQLKKKKNIELQGTHTHSQSQNLRVRDAVQNFQFALDASRKLAGLLGQSLKFVNIGGGLGVAYGLEQEPASVLDFAKEVNSLVDRSRQSGVFSDATFALEFGRFLVAPAGFFVTRVVTLKKSEGRHYAITDGGFTQAQIVCGVGQLIRKNFVMSVIHGNSGVLKAISQERKERVTICGPSCYSSDILAEDIELPKLEVGDLIVVPNLGAYGATFSPQDFLLQKRAAEFFF